MCVFLARFHSTTRCREASHPKPTKSTDLWEASDSEPFSGAKSSARFWLESVAKPTFTKSRRSEPKPTMQIRRPYEKKGICGKGVWTPVTPLDGTPIGTSYNILCLSSCEKSLHLSMYFLHTKAHADARRTTISGIVAIGDVPIFFPGFLMRSTRRHRFPMRDSWCKAADTKNVKGIFPKSAALQFDREVLTEGRGRTSFDERNERAKGR